MGKRKTSFKVNNYKNLVRIAINESRHTLRKREYHERKPENKLLLRQAAAAE